MNIMKKFTLKKSQYDPGMLQSMTPADRLEYYLEHHEHILDTDLMPILGILPSSTLNTMEESRDHCISNVVRSLEAVGYKIRTGSRRVTNRFDEPVWVKFYTLEEQS